MEDTFILETVLKDVENKHRIITLLECLINEEINDFEYVGIQKFDTIIEYDFSLIKINLILKNNERKIIYIRIIKGGQVKESIFCYWSLIYEQYLNDNKFDKVTIAEKSVEQNKKNIILNMNKGSNYSTEIALVELKKYIIEKSEHKEELKELLKCLNIHDKDILFLGIIGY